MGNNMASMINIKVRGADAIRALRDNGQLFGGGIKGKGMAAASGAPHAFIIPGNPVMMGQNSMGTPVTVLLPGGNMTPVAMNACPGGAKVGAGAKLVNMDRAARMVNMDVGRAAAGGKGALARGAEMEGGRMAAMKPVAATVSPGATGQAAAASKAAAPATAKAAGMAPSAATGIVKAVPTKAAFAAAPAKTAAAAAVKTAAVAGASTGTIWTGTGLSLGLGLGLGALGPVLALSALGLTAAGVYMYRRNRVQVFFENQH